MVTIQESAIAASSDRQKPSVVPAKTMPGNGWMLQDRARPARLRRNALNLAPAFTGVLAFVDTAARGSNDVIWIARIDIDREDVGVVDHSVLDRLPGLPPSTDL